MLLVGYRGIGENMIFYSKINKGFFIEGINDIMPDDVVKVNADLYKELMSEQQLDGKVIVPDKNGFPSIWFAKVDPCALAENYRKQLLSEIDNVISDWRVELMLGEISNENKENLSSWMEYKKRVKLTDTSTAPDINWPTSPGNQVSL